VNESKKKKKKPTKENSKRKEEQTTVNQMERWGDGKNEDRKEGGMALILR
jgi:hypothetical protein